MKITYIKDISSKNNFIQIRFSEEAYDQLVCNDQGSQTLFIGVKEPEKINYRKLHLLARKIVQTSKKQHLKKIAFDFNDLNFKNLKLQPTEIAEIVSMNMELANYTFNRYKTQPKEGWPEIQELVIIGDLSTEIKNSWKKGQLIGMEINRARDLSNIPGTDMTPDLLAQEAKKIAKENNLKIRVLSAKEMKALNMNAILSVGMGSKIEPHFIILEHQGASNKKEQPIVLVGKGITFDSGGLNIKPGNGMDDMHLDMSGAAAVLHTICLAAKTGLKRNIVVLIPAAESMISGSSFRPGDIIKTMSGKTIEIRNTDAEGRLILSDALTYAKKYNPSLVVDVATLTAAAMVALGYRASATFTKDEKLSQFFTEMGEKSGDYVWPLPLWDEYEAEVKGTFADLRNLGVYDRWGSASTGAAFLYQFAQDYPWIHVDIAPRTTPAPDELLAKGSAGAGVALLFKVLENYS